MTTIEFVENYRSTPSILEFSEHGLLVPATEHDDVDVEATRDRIVSLRSNSDHDETRIEAIRSSDEHEAVLEKIQEIVGNDEYRVEGEDGELLVEEEAYLPLTVDGERVTISGVVDLVHVLPDRVEIVDYKTDRGRHTEDEYRKQLSVYYHVVTAQYPDRAVTASIFYTDEAMLRTIDPQSVAALEELVVEARSDTAAVDSDR